MRTGLPLSPYFSAAKLAWILEHQPEAETLSQKGDLCCGTMDSWLIYRLTGGREFRTDYSNASRTQLFHIERLSWDETLCGYFGIPVSSLPEVTDSDGWFGNTDLEGLLPAPVPIHGVLGDSHGALFGQGCTARGMMKATYGTGSSIMMNVGQKPVFSRNGIAASLAWKIGGRVQYVLEGNINYAGAVIAWLEEQAGLITEAEESARLAAEADSSDHTYLVPAFSGMGAPYWSSGAEAAFVGMSRVTGRAELVKAGLCSIAYQIRDVVELMRMEAGTDPEEIRVDGGPTRNQWLMQFQSDILRTRVLVSDMEELSAKGAALAAALGYGLCPRNRDLNYCAYTPHMGAKEQTALCEGWKKAAAMVLGNGTSAGKERV